MLVNLPLWIEYKQYSTFKNGPTKIISQREIMHRYSPCDDVSALELASAKMVRSFWYKPAGVKAGYWWTVTQLSVEVNVRMIRIEVKIVILCGFNGARDDDDQPLSLFLLPIGALLQCQFVPRMRAGLAGRSHWLDFQCCTAWRGVLTLHRLYQ